VYENENIVELIILTVKQNKSSPGTLLSVLRAKLINTVYSRSTVPGTLTQDETFTIKHRIIVR